MRQRACLPDYGLYVSHIIVMVQQPTNHSLHIIGVQCARIGWPLRPCAVVQLADSNFLPLPVQRVYRQCIPVGVINSIHDWKSDARNTMKASSLNKDNACFM